MRNEYEQSANRARESIGPMITAAEIRDALQRGYPDVTNPEFNVEQSGVADEHPLIAIGVVLISSMVLATIDPVRLVECPTYRERFVRL